MGINCFSTYHNTSSPMNFVDLSIIRIATALVPSWRIFSGVLWDKNRSTKLSPADRVSSFDVIVFVKECSGLLVIVHNCIWIIYEFGMCVCSIFTSCFWACLASWCGFWVWTWIWGHLSFLLLLFWWKVSTYVSDLNVTVSQAGYSGLWQIWEFWLLGGGGEHGKSFLTILNHMLCRVHICTKTLESSPIYFQLPLISSNIKKINFSWFFCIFTDTSTIVYSICYHSLHEGLLLILPWHKCHSSSLYWEFGQAQLFGCLMWTGAKGPGGNYIQVRHTHGPSLSWTPMRRWASNCHSVI